MEIYGVLVVSLGMGYVVFILEFGKCFLSYYGFDCVIVFLVIDDVLCLKFLIGKMLMEEEDFNFVIRFI